MRATTFRKYANLIELLEFFVNSLSFNLNIYLFSFASQLKSWNVRTKERSETTKKKKIQAKLSNETQNGEKKNAKRKIFLFFFFLVNKWWNCLSREHRNVENKVQQRDRTHVRAWISTLYPSGVYALAFYARSLSVPARADCDKHKIHAKSPTHTMGSERASTHTRTHMYVAMRSHAQAHPKKLACPYHVCACVSVCTGQTDQD